ncbi:Uncharacterised protein [Salmonella enterica subsp. arizonae]|uniref:Uncharacterized protein n=1 Tax=Salmonella enterica subsp. arizonae TaxID=59203 RepID=A0A379S652_SALER|nr:Uncharacterised protein [Salmonella enterica subsp. arizonae]
MIVQKRDKVLCQEQRVTAARAGVLDGGAVTDRYCAVFQNELYRNAFARLTYRGKARGYRRAGIDKSIVTRAVFNRLLIVKIE